VPPEGKGPRAQGSERASFSTSRSHLFSAFLARFAEPKATLRKLFSRLTFNVLSGNTDDHARNHAAFWDGAELTLTPTYDVCPLPRTGGEASQAIAIGRDGYRLSQVAACVVRGSTYLLTEEEAREIVDRHRLWVGAFFNPHATEGYSGG